MTTFNAQDIKFGIEIETHIPREAVPNRGGYHSGRQVEWLFDGWNSQSDSSVSAPYGENRVDCEFVSPKLSGDDGIAQVVKAVEEIVIKGGRVNASCGIHVSVNFDGDAGALARLICLVARYEKALYASTGTHTRERGSYSVPIKSRYVRTDEGSKPKEKIERVKNNYMRTSMLNLTHMCNDQGRVEFRIFSGSLSPAKIVAWIRICVGLVELSYRSTKNMGWDIKGEKKPNPTAGTGETQLVSLMYKLGWIKGNAKRHYGDILSQRGNTFFSDCGPTIKECRKEMRRMAKKYDEEAAVQF